MTLDEAVVAALLDDTGVTDLVVDRVHPDGIEGKVAAPYITWSRIFTGPIQYVDGSLANAENARIQLSCWADSMAQAVALAVAVRTAMLASTDVTAVWLDEQTLFDTEGRRRGRALDFSVWFQPA